MKGRAKLNQAGGAGGIRTPYLLTASQMFSRLNYSPIIVTYVYLI